MDPTDSQPGAPQEGASNLDTLNTAHPVDQVLGAWKNYFMNLTGMAAVSFFRSSPLNNSRAEMILGHLVFTAAHSGRWEKVQFGDEVKPGTYDEVKAQLMPGLKTGIDQNYLELIVEDGQAYIAPAENMITDIQARIARYEEPFQQTDSRKEPEQSPESEPATESNPTPSVETVIESSKTAMKKESWLKRILQGLRGL